MPEPSSSALTVLMVLFASIVGAWIWVVVRLALGQPVLPPRTPRVVPWGAKSVLLVVLAWIALNAVVQLGYHKWIRPQPVGNEVGVRRSLAPAEMMALLSIQNSATLVLIPVLLAATSGARLRDYGIAVADLGKQVARGIVAYPLLAPVVFGVNGVCVLIWGRTPHPVEDAIAQNKSPGLVALSVLAAVILAPLAEELIFRGVLLGWLTRLALGEGKPKWSDSIGGGIDEYLAAGQGFHQPETMDMGSIEAAPLFLVDQTVEMTDASPYPPPITPIATADVLDPKVARSRAFRLFTANVFVSLIFAALHGPVWPTPIPIFFLSLGLGLLYQRTGGLLASIALHMTFNGISTLMMFLLLGGNPAPKPLPKVVEPIPVPVPAAMADRFFLSIGPVDGPGEV